MIVFKTGDLLQSQCDVLVNTINCVGVMGKGIALQFKHAYPRMFEEYRKLCYNHAITPGSIYLWENSEPSMFECNHRVLNFATKDDWRNPSQIEWIYAGLQHLARNNYEYFKQHNISSIAFPKLGCNNGKLNWIDQVKPLMIRYLEPASDKIRIEIYE